MDAERTRLVTEFDYAEAIIDCPHDQLQQMRVHFDSIEADLSKGGESVSPLVIKVLRIPAPRGESVYRLSAYGALAAHLAAYFFHYRWGCLTRLDLKVVLPDLDEQGLIPIVRAATSPGNKTTVQTFNARPRAHKTTGAHTGGYGLAVGSGNSDTRATVYKKPGEPAQMEVQLSGKPLLNLVVRAREAWQDWLSKSDKNDSYQTLVGHVEARLYDVLVRKLLQAPDVLKALNEATGLSLEHTYRPVNDFAVWNSHQPRNGRRIVYGAQTTFDMED